MNLPVSTHRKRPSSQPASPLPLQGVMPVDLHEAADGLHLYADLPGVAIDDVRLDYAHDTLTLRAQRKRTAPGRLVAGEIADAELARSFVLPRGIDTPAIRAEFKDGVLHVHLPRTEQARPRTIPVQVA